MTAEAGQSGEKEGGPHSQGGLKRCVAEAAEVEVPDDEAVVAEVVCEGEGAEDEDDDKAHPELEAAGGRGRIGL